MPLLFPPTHNPSSCSLSVSPSLLLPLFFPTTSGEKGGVPSLNGSVRSFHRHQLALCCDRGKPSCFSRPPSHPSTRTHSRTCTQAADLSTSTCTFSRPFHAVPVAFVVSALLSSTPSSSSSLSQTCIKLHAGRPPGREEHGQHDPARHIQPGLRYVTCRVVGGGWWLLVFCPVRHFAPQFFKSRPVLAALRVHLIHTSRRCMRIDIGRQKGGHG